MFNKKVVSALQDWFLGTDGRGFNESLESLYKIGCLKSLYEMTQRCYKQNDISNVKVYRWESSSRYNRILESWATDKSTAMSYSELRKGHMKEKIVPASAILLDVYMLSDMCDIDWDEIIGVMPCSEVIVINNKIL